MRVIYHDVVRLEPKAEKELELEFVSLEDLVRQADVITLHAPLTSQTRHLIDRSRLRLMKPGALLINTARGGLIDNEALYEALDTKQLGGAGLDVYETEPLPPHSPLRRLENAVLTPHVGAGTREAAEKMGVMAVQNLVDVLSGRRPRFVVNPEAYAGLD